MIEPIIPGDGPEKPVDETIKIPERVKYGIFIYETTDELAETGIHVHAPGDYANISVGHLLRLLVGATLNLDAELIWQKFRHKAQQKKIIVPGGTA